MTVLNTRQTVYQLKWGEGSRQIALPRDNVVAEMRMTDLPPLPDVAGAVLGALERPIGARPLSEQVRPGMKVALVTGDRITDYMLGADGDAAPSGAPATGHGEYMRARQGGVGMALLDHLNRLGVRDEDVTLVHAGGTHPNLDWRDRLGARLTARVSASRHDPWDEESLAFVGVTERCTPVWVNRALVEADLSIAFGEISPTVHGGWCGGGKIVLPGVAGLDSIEQNHSFMMRDLNTVGLVDGNHMRQDMEEGARLAGLDLKVDVLIDSRGRVVDVYAGDFVAEHRAALPKARQIWMTKMDPVDVVVVYPGEPFEEYLQPSLWIRLEGADLALKPGGIIIIALSAARGWTIPWMLAHHQATDAAGLRQTTEQMARAMARKQGMMRNVSMNYSARRVLERRRTFLVCDGIAPDEAEQMGFAACTPDFDRALAMALDERGKDATIATNIGGRIAWRLMPWREG
jgi:nickel-dependent lactate racemase